MFMVFNKVHSNMNKEKKILILIVKALNIETRVLLLESITILMILVTLSMNGE